MSRQPRGTGYCHGCARRILLTTQGKLFLHASKPNQPVGIRVLCPGSMTRDYKPAPDFTYKEPPRR